MLAAVAPDGRVLGIEADERTLNETRANLQSYGSRFIGINGNFRDLRGIASANGIGAVDAILFDLGLSSIALGDPTRGFSFQHDGPLDMRFDPSTSSGQVPTETAADIVNTRSARELAELFRTYGDEPVAERIADQIVLRRTTEPFTTTVQLADAISAVKHRRGRIHPATQVFQALRITVNDEYGAIEAALPQGLELLKSGGRMAVITFHSGEDRLVKYWMKQMAAEGRLHLDTKHVIVAPRAEQVTNPRSRSAKLRIITKQSDKQN
jgi:16S rRNA (cytosine1402-N4)-methyltransferase